MVGVRVALGNRLVTVKASRQYAKDGKEESPGAYITMNFTRPFAWSYVLSDSTRAIVRTSGLFSCFCASFHIHSSLNTFILCLCLISLTPPPPGISGYIIGAGYMLIW